MIYVENLSKSYGNNHVLRGVDLRIEKGLCTALVGRNGSGKSTLVDIVCKAKKANSGMVRYDFAEEKIFDYMGVQLKDASFDSRLKVREVLYM